MEELKRRSSTAARPPLVVSIPAHQPNERARRRAGQPRPDNRPFSVNGPLPRNGAPERVQSRPVSMLPGEAYPAKSPKASRRRPTSLGLANPGAATGVPSTPSLRRPSSKKRISTGTMYDSDSDDGASVTGLLAAAIQARRDAKERTKRLSNLSGVSSALSPILSPTSPTRSWTPTSGTRMSSPRAQEMDLSLPVYVPDPDGESSPNSFAPSEDQEITPTAHNRISYIDAAPMRRVGVNMASKAVRQSGHSDRTLTMIEAINSAADRSLKLQEELAKPRPESTHVAEPEVRKKPSMLSMLDMDSTMVATTDWPETEAGIYKLDLDDLEAIFGKTPKAMHCPGATLVSDRSRQTTRPLDGGVERHTALSDDQETAEPEPSAKVLEHVSILSLLDTVLQSPDPVLESATPTPVKPRPPKQSEPVKQPRTRTPSPTRPPTSASTRSTRRTQPKIVLTGRLSTDPLPRESTLDARKRLLLADRDRPLPPIPVGTEEFSETGSIVEVQVDKPLPPTPARFRLFKKKGSASEPGLFAKTARNVGRLLSKSGSEQSLEGSPIRRRGPPGAGGSPSEDWTDDEGATLAPTNSTSSLGVRASIVTVSSDSPSDDSRFIVPARMSSIRSIKDGLSESGARRLHSRAESSG